MAAKVKFLTSGTSLVVSTDIPDWNNANNSVECIGGTVTISGDIVGFNHRAEYLAQREGHITCNAERWDGIAGMAV